MRPTLVAAGGGAEPQHSPPGAPAHGYSVVWGHCITPGMWKELWAGLGTAYMCQGACEARASPDLGTRGDLGTAASGS